MILVFGGAGQLGQELARTAASGSVPLRALSRAEVDIADNEAVARVLRETRPSLVVNAAAYTKVDLAEREVDDAERSNVRGAAFIAAACAAADLPLVHISTDYVFDGRKATPYLESDPVAPIGVYGRTKAEGEDAVRRPHAQHVILRTAWVYGEFGTNFLKTMVRLAREHSELRVVADQRGCPTSTRDLAGSILRIAPRLAARQPVWGTYHFAGSGITSWHGFAERIVAAQAPLTGRRPYVKAISSAEYPTAARRPQNSALDCTRFTDVFGFGARPWQQEADEITVAAAEALQASEDVHAT